MRTWLLVGAMVVSAQSFADQCAVVTPAQAKAALKVLRKGTMYFVFCEPCGDNHAPEPHAVTSVKVTAFDEKDKQLLVNDHEVDLAYLYVKTKGAAKFTNVASLVKCKAEGVTVLIDPASPPEERRK